MLVVLCRILYPGFPGFLERDNIFNILSQNAQVGLIALGMTLVMIAGGFDLSVGAIAIAIVIIGGTSPFSGSAAVWRTAVGLLLLAVLTNIPRFQFSIVDQGRDRHWRGRCRRIHAPPLKRRFQPLRDCSGSAPGRAFPHRDRARCRVQHSFSVAPPLWADETSTGAGNE